MEKVVVEIGFVDGQYSAHLPVLPRCITVGSSLKEIEDNIAEVVPFHIEGQYQADGEVATVFNGDYTFTYKLSIAALLNYCGIFTKAA